MENKSNLLPDFRIPLGELDVVGLYGQVEYCDKLKRSRSLAGLQIIAPDLAELESNSFQRLWRIVARFFNLRGRHTLTNWPTNAERIEKMAKSE